MFLGKIIIFLISYVISFSILILISSKLRLKKWFGQNYIRKIIVVIMSIIIYVSGNGLMDKFNIIGDYHTIIKGFLLAIIAITASVIIPNVSKNKTRDSKYSGNLN
ncbi:hypothetical protein [Clostridium sp.]|uniref:hypothetical protein n=1 Tax=Clostridium sp. TaxID=1506 RepID=UPI00261D5CAF|nr:hypothetical protein [Clostridium sp.]